MPAVSSAGVEPQAASTHAARATQRRCARDQVGRPRRGNRDHQHMAPQRARPSKEESGVYGSPRDAARGPGPARRRGRRGRHTLSDEPRERRTVVLEARVPPGASTRPSCRWPRVLAQLPADPHRAGARAGGRPCVVRPAAKVQARPGSCSRSCPPRGRAFRAGHRAVHRVRGRAPGGDRQARRHGGASGRRQLVGHAAQRGVLHHHPAAATLPRAGVVHRLDKDTSRSDGGGQDAGRRDGARAVIAAREVHREVHRDRQRRRAGPNPSWWMRRSAAIPSRGCAWPCCRRGRPARTDVTPLAVLEPVTARRSRGALQAAHRPHAPDPRAPRVARVVRWCRCTLRRPARARARAAGPARGAARVRAPGHGEWVWFDAAPPADLAAAWETLLGEGVDADS